MSELENEFIFHDCRGSEMTGRENSEHTRTHHEQNYDGMNGHTLELGVREHGRRKGSNQKYKLEGYFVTKPCQPFDARVKDNQFILRIGLIVGMI